MILKTFFTEKVPVACTTILGLIFSTRWCSITQGANFVAFMCVVIESVTRVTYILLGHSSLDVGNYIVVPIVRIIKKVQFLGRMGISTANKPIRAKSIKYNNFVLRKVVLKLLKFFKAPAIRQINAGSLQDFFNSVLQSIPIPI